MFQNLGFGLSGDGFEISASVSELPRGRARMASVCVAYLLWALGGWFGLHHFYLGRCVVRSRLLGCLMHHVFSETARPLSGGSYLVDILDWGGSEICGGFLSM